MGDMTNPGDVVEQWLSNQGQECKTGSAENPEILQSPLKGSKVSHMTARADIGLQKDLPCLDRELSGSSERSLPSEVVFFFHQDTEKNNNQHKKCKYR